MTIETTYILKADEGKILQNKLNPEILTPSVWLKIGDSKDDWLEIDIPEPDADQEPAENTEPDDFAEVDDLLTDINNQI